MVDRSEPLSLWEGSCSPSPGLIPLSQQFPSQQQQRQQLPFRCGRLRVCPTRKPAVLLTPPLWSRSTTVPIHDRRPVSTKPTSSTNCLSKASLDTRWSSTRTWLILSAPCARLDQAILISLPIFRRRCFLGREAMQASSAKSGMPSAREF